MACHDPRRQGMKQGITVCSMAQHGTDSRQMGKNRIIALAALRRESCGIPAPDSVPAPPAMLR